MCPLFPRVLSLYLPTHANGIVSNSKEAGKKDYRDDDGDCLLRDVTLVWIRFQWSVGLYFDWYGNSTGFGGFVREFRYTEIRIFT